MERLHARTLVPLVVSLLLAAACDGTTDGRPNSAATSPRPVTTPTCPNHDAVVSDASLAKPGSLTGDVDGDGSEDEVRLAVDEGGPEDCRAFVIVDSGDVVHALGIEQDGMTFDLNLPQLRGLAEIDGRAGAEIVVDLVAGASTQFAGAFTMGRGPLERLEIAEGVASSDLFAYGGSVGHLDGVDCAPDDEIVVTTAVPRGVRYLVERRFLVLDEGEFRTTRTERARAPFEGLAERYPELAGAPFATCPSA
ncbi:MAG: hypothetical protein ACRDKB_08085 [Actinomycetota bacterium]